MPFQWPTGYVWRSHLGGRVTPEEALADARSRWLAFAQVGMVEIEYLTPAEEEG